MMMELVMMELVMMELVMLELELELVLPPSSLNP
jgi:hypothetical protein